MLQWNCICNCGSSFAHTCVQDVSQTKATAAFWSGKAQRSSSSDPSGTDIVVTTAGHLCVSTSLRPVTCAWRGRPVARRPSTQMHFWRQPQLNHSVTNRIGLKHPSWSSPNRVWEIRLKRKKFLIKFVLKVFTFSSGGYMSTL